MGQGIYTVFQMIPNFRSSDFVQQDGASYWYFVACLFQSAWTFAFGYEIIWLSAVMMAGILVSLVNIVKNQNSVESNPNDVNTDYWLYKFPFSIHCGWIAVAFAVNINVWLTAHGGASTAMKEYFAYGTLFYA